MPGPALVVGLGNPGPEYERTRHNLGFRVIDVLADRLGARVKPAKGMRALVAEARDGDARIILAKPTTFMNASGAAVSELARYYKVAPRDVVIVHDELDLPVAQLKVKRGGGDPFTTFEYLRTQSLVIVHYWQFSFWRNSGCRAQDAADMAALGLD